MAQVIHLKGKRTFSLEEARALLPIIRKITMASVGKSEKILLQMEALDRSSNRRKKLEAQLNQLIEEWVCKVERLGCEAKGLWLVDFDSGTGYYCWQYGEDDICFFHGYSEGFAGRRPLDLPHYYA